MQRKPKGKITSTHFSAIGGIRPALRFDFEMLLDREFHRLIARAAHNTVLAEILLKLHERSLRLWFISLAAPDHRGSVNDQHHRIFQAIGHRDVEAAENAMRADIDSFRRNVLRSL